MLKLPNYVKWPLAVFLTLTIPVWIVPFAAVLLLVLVIIAIKGALDALLG